MDEKEGSSFANRKPRLHFFLPRHFACGAGVENGKGIADIEMAIRRVGEEGGERVLQ